MDNYPRYQADQQPVPPPAGLPVKVRLPAQKPLMTYALIGVTVVVYLLQLLSTSLSQGGVDWPFLLGGKINAYILRGELWRLLTPALLHGSLLHIAFNMYALYSLGTSLERYYGHMQGVEPVRAAVRAAIRRGVRYLTLYAFSTENWGRPAEEIDALPPKHFARTNPALVVERSVVAVLDMPPFGSVSSINLS